MRIGRNSGWSGDLGRHLRNVKHYLVEPLLRGALLVRQLRGQEVKARRAVRCKLERHGKGFYGEWHICPDVLPERPVVYSIGVGKDISFDLDMIRRRGAQVYAFDPTPLSQAWLREQSLPTAFEFQPYGLADYDGQADFALPPAHTVSYSMLEQPKTGHRARGEVRRLPTIVEQLGHRHIDVLKIDIEGMEYSVLPDILAMAPQITQLLIEFHHRMLGPSGIGRTEAALSALHEAGFLLFHVSATGLEYSFVHKACLDGS